MDSALERLSAKNFKVLYFPALKRVICFYGMENWYTATSDKFEDPVSGLQMSAWKEGCLRWDLCMYVIQITWTAGPLGTKRKGWFYTSSEAHINEEAEICLEVDKMAFHKIKKREKNYDLEYIYFSCDIRSQ